MDESQLMLPTVDEYVRAFEAADAAGKITPKQRKMLIFHHSQSARAVSNDQNLWMVLGLVT